MSILTKKLLPPANTIYGVRCPTKEMAQNYKETLFVLGFQMFRTLIDSIAPEKKRNKILSAFDRGSSNIIRCVQFTLDGRKADALPAFDIGKVHMTSVFKDLFDIRDANLTQIIDGFDEIRAGFCEILNESSDIHIDRGFSNLRVVVLENLIKCDYIEPLAYYDSQMVLMKLAFKNMVMAMS